MTSKISKEELAWILLNFNQKRGYYQLRGEEEEENNNKLVEFYALKVVAVEDSGEKRKRIFGIMCIWKMDGCIEEQVIYLLIGLEKLKNSL